VCAEPIHYTGTTVLVRDTGEEMIHNLTVVIDDDRVVVAVAGYGNDTASHPPLISDDPAVVAFARAVDQARRLTMPSH
jgi:hypothetical protein